MRFSWNLIPRSLSSVYLAWQLFVVVRRLRRRSSFTKISRRPSLRQVDLVLRINGRLTQGIISVQRAETGIEIHFRPHGLVELAEVDKALVPHDPDGRWPLNVKPPVAEAGVVSVNTMHSVAEDIAVEWPPADELPQAA